MTDHLNLDLQDEARTLRFDGVPLPDIAEKLCITLEYAKELTCECYPYEEQWEPEREECEREEIRQEYFKEGRSICRDQEALALAITCELPTEVLQTAFDAYKHGGAKTIADAIQEGFNEWLK